MSSLSFSSSSSSLSSSPLSSGLSQQRPKEHDHHRSRRRRSVLFKDTVRIRKHVHFKDITPEEKVAAWFDRFEYQEISENNSIIKQKIGKLNKKKKKMDNNNKIRKIIKKISEKKEKGTIQENQMQNKQQVIQKQQQYHIGRDNEDFFEKEEELCCEQKGYSTRGLEKRRSAAEKISSKICIHNDECELEIVKMYSALCRQCTNDARKRGLHDEKIARRIYQQSQDDYSFDQEYTNNNRRRSSASTANMIECNDFEDYNNEHDCNSCLNHNEKNKNSKQSYRKMNHAKKFLRRLSFPPPITAS